MDTVGKRIRHARKMSNLSLTTVKNLTGLSTGNLSELENDKFLPSANALISFRKVFNISIDWLLTGETPMRPINLDNVKETQSNYLTEEERAFMEAYKSLDLGEKRYIHGFIKVVTCSKKTESE